MSEWVNKRLDARKRWSKATFDKQSAELRHGVGSTQWDAAFRAERQAQQDYNEAAHKERLFSPLG